MPNFFSNLKPKSWGRSNMNPMSISPSQLQAQTTYQELVSAFHTINLCYCITWECANLLIELGEGRNNSQDSDILSGPPTSTSLPITSQTATTVQVGIATKRSTDRAITLGGDESKSPPFFRKCSTTLMCMQTQWQRWPSPYAANSLPEESPCLSFQHPGINKDWRLLKMALLLPVDDVSIPARTFGTVDHPFEHTLSLILGCKLANYPAKRIDSWT